MRKTCGAVLAGLVLVGGLAGGGTLLAQENEGGNGDMQGNMMEGMQGDGGGMHGNMMGMMAQMKEMMEKCNAMMDDMQEEGEQQSDENA